MVTQFTWDARKAEENAAKHGVSFDEAATVFLDPMHHEATEEVRDEERWVMVGRSALDRVLLVVYFEVDEDTARIISARRATKREREEYEEGI